MAAHTGGKIMNAINVIILYLKKTLGQQTLGVICKQPMWYGFCTQSRAVVLYDKTLTRHLFWNTNLKSIGQKIPGEKTYEYGYFDNIF